MIKIKQWTVLMLLLMPLAGCFESSTELVDEYRIYPQDGFGSGYYLICKLSCDNDPKIENVESVKWNDQFIVVKKEREKSQESWYVIEAKGEKLKCCNGDTITGPLTQQEMTDYLAKKGAKNLKEKSFK